MATFICARDRSASLLELMLGNASIHGSIMRTVRRLDEGSRKLFKTQKQKTPVSDGTFSDI